MVVSRRVHAAEQNGETGRTALKWGDTLSHRRALRHRDVEGDERWASHGREEHDERETQSAAAAEPPVCHIGYTCIINGRCGLTIKPFHT